MQSFDGTPSDVDSESSSSYEETGAYHDEANSAAPHGVHVKGGALQTLPQFHVQWSTLANGETHAMPLPRFLHSGCTDGSHFQTMTAARRLIRRRQIYVNSEVASCATEVNAGDSIVLVVYDSPSDDASAKREETIRILDSASIIYEDSDIIAFSKPTGILVHAPQQAHNIGEATMQDLGLAKGAIAPVHRLDRGTSGVLLFAKSAYVFSALKNRWNDSRCTSKCYIALIQGYPSQRSWVVDSPLTKPCMAGDKGRRKRSQKRQLEGQVAAETGAWIPKAASTSFQIVGEQISSGFACLVLCHLEQGGRTHQIRRHLQQSGYPVVGDDRYGAHGPANKYMRKRFKSNRLFLHAWRCGFVHPHTEERLVLDAPLPPDFQDIIMKLEGGADALKHFEQLRQLPPLCPST